MAFLADYCLPAQVGEDGCDPDFATVREEQFDGVRAMVSERRVAVGLSALAAWDWTAAGNRKTAASMVNTLRSGIEETLRDYPFTSYIDTDIYPSGSPDGMAWAHNLTKWTKASLFASAGIGNGANWTNTPDRKGATPAYGSTLSSNTRRWAEHLNEIVLACQRLTHAQWYNVSRSQTSAADWTFSVRAHGEYDRTFPGTIQLFGSLLSATYLNSSFGTGTFASPWIGVDGLWHDLGGVAKPSYPGASASLDVSHGDSRAANAAMVQGAQPGAYGAEGVYAPDFTLTT